MALNFKLLNYITKYYQKLFIYSIYQFWYTLKTIRSKWASQFLKLPIPMNSQALLNCYYYVV